METAEERVKAQRPYRFFSGRLANKYVDEITDDELDWAIRWNLDYIDKHNDQYATVRYKGKVVAVGSIPSHEVYNRIGYAKAAIAACREEKARRGPQPHFSVATDKAGVDLVAMAREASHRSALAELSRVRIETMNLLSQLRSCLARIADIEDSLTHNGPGK